jgi:hypothetical protein
LLEKLSVEHKEVTLTEVGVIGVMADYLVAKMGGYLKQLCIFQSANTSADSALIVCEDYAVEYIL